MKKWVRVLLCVLIIAACYGAVRYISFYFCDPSHNELYPKEELIGRGYHSVKTVLKKTGKDVILNLENDPSLGWMHSSQYCLTYPQGSPEQATDLHVYYRGIHKGDKDPVTVYVEARLRHIEGQTLMDYLYAADDAIIEPVTVLDTPVLYYQDPLRDSSCIEKAAFEYDGVYYKVSSGMEGKEALLKLCEGLLRSREDF